MEQTFYKVRNPKTGRLIDAYGDTFNNLIKNKEYTEEELLKNKFPTGKAPKSTKIKQHYKNYEKKLGKITLPDEIIFEEIIMQMKTPDFMSICQSNKKFNSLCKNETFWLKMYYKYYGDSGMKELLSDINNLELFKTCYNLSFIQKAFTDGRTLQNLYILTNIKFGKGTILKRYLNALSYMHHLINISIVVDNITKPVLLPESVNNLPFLESITYVKE